MANSRPILVCLAKSNNKVNKYKSWQICILTILILVASQGSFRYLELDI